MNKQTKIAILNTFHSELTSDKILSTLDLINKHYDEQDFYYLIVGKLLSLVAEHPNEIIPFLSGMINVQTTLDNVKLQNRSTAKIIRAVYRFVESQNKLPSEPEATIATTCDDGTTYVTRTSHNLCRPKHQLSFEIESNEDSKDLVQWLGFVMGSGTMITNPDTIDISKLFNNNLSNQLTEFSKMLRTATISMTIRQVALWNKVLVRNVVSWKSEFCSVFDKFIELNQDLIIDEHNSEQLFSMSDILTYDQLMWVISRFNFSPIKLDSNQLHYMSDVFALIADPLYNTNVEFINFVKKFGTGSPFIIFIYLQDNSPSRQYSVPTNLIPVMFENFNPVSYYCMDYIINGDDEDTKVLYYNVINDRLFTNHVGHIDEDCLIDILFSNDELVEYNKILPLVDMISFSIISLLKFIHENTIYYTDKLKFVITMMCSNNTDVLERIIELSSKTPSDKQLVELISNLL